MDVYPADVAWYLGRDPAKLDDAQVRTHLSVVTAMVRAYTRGGGFTARDGGREEPADDLAGVIISSVARLVTNPDHEIASTVGQLSNRPGIFDGWTLPELAVLHRYRRRLA